ncbi:monovalent cation:H+ antiporter-2, CPA2 family [Tistlia consotensis]|uniref:Monovalent cation:H+ antiporter-2, CPA2 family n=1 Tax=Tistlia consotensis USBA 355 TaxID=560819 RepID=A0A1Y6C311_9PROT|nr:cation:proton antiporter [Tistlia consotensis]SMF39086.1 monovalent cation:H+ antiporter-2, CPA2 family [Tistlia consotensis USBA 355]SNR36555.1 monovalent cation:H+ antiporter-2, CPA2 family [Tistlia consotensis]
MESLHDQSQLTGIAIVALVALGCGMAMARLRQPAVVGYILAGALLGPSALGLVHDRAAISLLAELGVLMLLFLLGMELSLRAFREVWKIAVATTVVQIAAGVGVTWLAALATGWPIERVVLLGFVVALSSTAVAVKMLEEIGELRTRVGQVTVGVLIAQDLAVVPMMLSLDALGSGGLAGREGLVAGLRMGLSLGFLVLLLLYLGRRQRLRLPFQRLVGKSVDLTPLAGLVFCFGAAAASGLLGLSPAYGAFLAGLVVGNSTARTTMMRHTEPIQAVLLMVFFLSVGLLLDVRYVLDNFLSVLLLLFLIIGLKTALNVLAIRAFGESWPRAFLSGVLLAQIGEFSFVLVATALALGIAGPDEQRLIVALTVLSLTIAPLWLGAARQLHRAILLGVTSGPEAVRLTLGPLRQGTGRARRRAGALALRLSVAGRQARRRLAALRGGDRAGEV